MRRPRFVLAALGALGLVGVLHPWGLADASDGHKLGSQPDQQVEFRFAYTGSGAHGSLVSIPDSTLIDSQVLSTDGNVRVYVSPRPPGISMGCERRTDDPCTITAILTVSPARATVKVGVRVNSHSTLTAKVLPDGDTVPLKADGTYSLTP